MKNTLCVLLLILLISSSHAQDLIVTNEGDSINCKITKVKTDYIYFTFKHKDEIRNTLLPLSDIKLHETNFYSTSEVPADKVIAPENYQHFRIAINGGFSYQTAKIAENVSSDFEQYVKGLRSGYHFGGDLSYFYSEVLGFGLKSYFFKSSNSMDNIYLTDYNGNTRTGKMSDDLTISFIGPTFSTRFLNYNKSNAFLMNISLGYLGYSNDAVLIDRYKITGSTVGLTFDIGYDIGISEDISLGFQISYLMGTLTKIDISDGNSSETIKLEEGQYESLNRIDFSVGLRLGK